MEFHYRRVGRWIPPVGLLGAAVAVWLWGPLAALAFALGAVGSWWNYEYLVKAVTTLTDAAQSGSQPRSGVLVVGLLARFLVLGGAAIAILRYSKNDGIAFGFGLLAAFLAICLELLYGRLWNSTKSG